MLHPSKTFPALQDGFYARAFLYVAPPVPTSHANFFLANSANAVTGIYGSGAQFSKFMFVHDPPDRGFNSSTGIPTNRWFCAEWQVNSATGAMRQWVDGAELTDFSPNPTGLPVGFLSSFSFGAQQFATLPQALDFWLDELALDAAPIGCDR